MDYLRFAAALAFVLALMGLLAFVLKRLGLAGPVVTRGLGKDRRLRLVEVLPLDSRRRAILLERDRKQHLVILGPGGETVVETNISPPDDHAPKES